MMDDETHVTEHSVTEESYGRYISLFIFFLYFKSIANWKYT